MHKLLQGMFYTCDLVTGSGIVIERLNKIQENVFEATAEKNSLKNISVVTV